MKKVLSIILIAVLFLNLVYTGFAEDNNLAEDISKNITITNDNHKYEIKKMFDRKFDTFFKFSKSINEITFKTDKSCHGIYVCWAYEPGEIEIYKKSGNEWVLFKSYEASNILHQFYELDGGNEYKIKPQKTGSKTGIAEIYFFSDGKLPSWVQQWKPTVEKADMLVLFAHPDDEVLFLGGTIPYYAGERKLNFIAAAMTYGNRMRKSELLNCLWTCGVKTYPVFLNVDDSFSRRLDVAYKTAGKKKVLNLVTELIRKYRPEVVVTQDINGEYGHGQHRMCADSAIKAFDYAADKNYTYDNSSEPWQVKKLYIHLYKENELVMDWDKPMESFDRKTPFEVAKEGYSMHKSQHRYKQFKVEPIDSKYSCYHFGLYKSTVGLDTIKNDFMENIK